MSRTSISLLIKVILRSILQQNIDWIESVEDDDDDDDENEERYQFGKLLVS